MELCQEAKKVNKLPYSFYLEDDVVELSRQLLGKTIFTYVNRELTGGMITETEAYRGPEDRASHAYQNRRTPRTEVMFHNGGICYVYLCYGIHSLLNVVTNKNGIPHAILIRAIEPLVGMPVMLRRRKKNQIDRTLTNGPGCVTQALGIDQSFNGISLLSSKIWIESNSNYCPEPHEILSTPRVGIDYAGEDAALPWRFVLKRGSK